MTGGINIIFDNITRDFKVTSEINGLTPTKHNGGIVLFKIN